ncbi:DUF4231 domain-containing protein [Heyndrickxia oleronia]|uniref:DUF4231 domain-containing protein n=1 Tax=Heyndrickxia oleronia TaxID=38875 RepID=UPI00204164C6|nr:DUF4231 domain-containing protein [Heyndrickxia oleronia]MCM3239597.1 DUF4231 domain-containing protein [Heyndrickxia oleronia]
MNFTEEDYIHQRLDYQISWYDKKSQKSQKAYKFLKVIEISASASIPLFTGFIVDFKFWVTIVGILGMVITIIEGWLALTKHHENWIEYRSICETLKHEKYMFLTRTGVYVSEIPFRLFVERIESIISKENVNWANLNNNQTHQG